MRIYACMRILNDMAMNRRPYWTSIDVIDFTKYYAEYFAMLGFQMLARTYAEQPAPESAAEDDHALVFGGDIS